MGFHTHTCQIHTLHNAGGGHLSLLKFWPGIPPPLLFGEESYHLNWLGSKVSLCMEVKEAGCPFSTSASSPIPHKQLLYGQPIGCCHPGTWIFSNWEKNEERASNPPPGWSPWQCEGPNRAFYPSSGFPGGASGKEPICECRRHEMRVQPLGGEDPLEEEMATHCSTLAWRIPWIGAWWVTVHGVTKRQDWSNISQHSTTHPLMCPWVVISDSCLFSEPGPQILQLILWAPSILLINSFSA